MSLLMIRLTRTGLLAALVTLAACATVNRPPDLSIEGALAIDGKKITDGIKDAATLVDTAVTNGDLTPVIALNVVTPLNVAANEAVRLAIALEAIDGAKTEADKAVGIEKAKPILEAVRKALNDGVAALPGGQGATVVASIKAALSVVLSLMSAFRMPVADLRPWEAEIIVRAAAGARNVLPLAALPLGLLLQLLPYLMQMYSTERQRWIDAHPGEAVPFPPDHELIAEFKSSGQDAADYTAGLMTKYQAALGG